MKADLGGVVPLSTVDWPGMAVTTIFLRGCPRSCWYCHNKELIKPGKPEEVKLKDLINPKCISGVVISGGEPLMQPQAVSFIAIYAHDRGLKVGLETSGYYPEYLSECLGLGLIDKVFLDIKETPGRVKSVDERGVDSLRACAMAGVPTEVRITTFPGNPSQNTIDHIIQFVKYYSNLAGSKIENIKYIMGVVR